jgi:two-component system phosphate regulon sensor histidine kinase PhoR
MTFRTRVFLAIVGTSALAVGASTLAHGVASGAAAGLAVGVVVGWLAASLVSARLRRIAETATRYARGDFSQPTLEYGRDEVGTVARVLDTSVRQLAQRLDEMTTERAQLATILSGMVEGVVLVDEDRRLVLANAAARRMLQLPENVSGRHYKDLIPDTDVTNLLTSALQGERPASMEVRIEHSRERTFVATAAGVEHDPEGGAVLVLHDVTDLRRTDQIRRDFVANVSHELRTPLTAIRGYVEALGDSPAEDDRKRFLEVISRHTHRMERLVHDLLRLARLDAGQEAIERSPVALDSLIGDVEAEMFDALVRKRQRVTCHFPADAATVTGDPSKLHDVFRNLVENASNYGPEDSAIDVASRVDGDRLVVTVADRGPGIPADDLPRIFERFSRADRSRARDSGGTGLGLAIVRHLVGLHGGTVSAAAREGGGTVVAVSLPHHLVSRGGAESAEKINLFGRS